MSSRSLHHFSVAALVATAILAFAAPRHAMAQFDLFEGNDEPVVEEESSSTSPSAIDLLQQASVQDELKLNSEQRPRIQAIIDDQKRRMKELAASQKMQLQGLSIGEQLRKRTEFREQTRAQEFETRTAADQAAMQLLDEQQRAALEKKLTVQQSAESNATPPDSANPNGSRSTDSRPTSTRGIEITKTSSSGASTTSSRSGPPPVRRTSSRPAIASFAPTFETAQSLPGSEPETIAVAITAGGETPAAAETAPSPPLLPGDDASTPPASATPATNSSTTPSPASVPQSEENQPERNGKLPTRLSFNFQDAPWPDVLKLFADAAGLTLNLRETPPGDFTYFDRGTYTPGEALDIMNRYLLQSGYILVRHDRFLTVLGTKGPIPPNLIETVTLDELPERGRTELLRVAMPLGDRDAQQAATEIRSLLGPQGSVVPLASANTVVVTDIVENLARVRKLMEPPPPTPVEQLIFRAFPMQHVAANTAADIVRDLFGLSNAIPNVSATSDRSQGRGGRGGRDRRAEMMRRFFGNRRGRNDDDNRNDDRGSSQTPNASGAPASRHAKVAVDARTNSVLVTATTADMQLAEDIIQSLDVAPSEIHGEFTAEANANERYLVAYEIENGDTGDVAKTLQVLHPGTVVNHDDDLKRIHVFANSAKHREIAIHVQQLDGAIGGQILTVIPLDGISPYETMATLTQLWANQPDKAPSVQVSGSNLIVKANAAQLLQINRLVDQLNALGDSPAIEDDRDMQFVQMNPDSAGTVEHVLQSMYGPQITISSTAAQATTANERQNAGTRRDRTRNDRSARNGNNDDEARRRAFRNRMRERRRGNRGNRGRGRGR